MMPLTPDERRDAMDLARGTVLARLGASPSSDPARGLDTPAGCFVSLHEAPTHRLRGCIGTLATDRPLGEAVAHAAAGVLEDPRFSADPVTPAEMPRLELELSILGPAEACGSVEEIDLSRGIILHLGDRRGVFLPQVAAETGWSREQLLERLCTEKLGLPAGAWQHPDARIETFAVEIVGPEPL